jgi:peroxiredoxin Q/BCP
MKIALSLCCLAALSLQDKMDLKVGDAAPAFEGPDDTGKAWKSADHVGKKIVVVFFFPAAFTGG